MSGGGVLGLGLGFSGLGVLGGLGFRAFGGLGVRGLEA